MNMRLFSDIKDKELLINEAADYLFRELSRGDTFVLSTGAMVLRDAFLDDLKRKKSLVGFRESLDQLKDLPLEQYRLAREWLTVYVRHSDNEDAVHFIPEAGLALVADNSETFNVIATDNRIVLKDFHGDHARIQDGTYQTRYPELISRLRSYRSGVAPRFARFQQLKRARIDGYRKTLRLDTFRPRVMSAFVRNKLIDRVYLPLIGDNLAKQLGTAGENTRTDRMGLLLLLSPPGYGKTTLMEYIANRLGLIFMKINGPTIGHRVHSLDPADAPNQAARKELEKLNLALEMGDNVMIYLDDIQHCHSEFLQKFISLCDAQRRIEGVWKGEAKTYDFRTKRVAVVMAGNPYTESGERFRIPDMLANRADIYNLGDIIGGQAEVFKLSYLENALTSNPTLSRLAGKSMADVYSLIQQAGQSERGTLDLQADHSPEELKEYLSVLEKLIRIREVILRVNQAYIHSAAIAEGDRTEPSFRLQGSYRNMNKLAEKVIPIMNDEELQTLILSHYEGELQTLTSGAEANRLKLHQLMGILSPQEANRWEEICKNFLKQSA